MADIPPPPLPALIAEPDRRMTTDWQAWIKLLEAKIRELERRLAALE